METILTAFSFMLTLLLSGFLGVLFAEIFVQMQSLIFRTADTIMFIQGDSYFLISLILSFTIGLCVQCYLQNLGKEEKDVSFIPKVIVALLVLGTFIELFPFFHYSRVTPEGIFIRHGLANETHYKFSQIRGVDLECIFPQYKGRSHAEINYILSLNDGNTINLYASKDFAKTILTVDDLLEKNNVPIVRHPISAINYLRRDTTNEEYFNTLLKLFHYDKTPQGTK